MTDHGTGIKLKGFSSFLSVGWLRLVTPRSVFRAGCNFCNTIKNPKKLRSNPWSVRLSGRVIFYIGGKIEKNLFPTKYGVKNVVKCYISVFT